MDAVMEKSARKLLEMAGCHTITTSDSASQMNSSCPYAFMKHAGGQDRRPSFTVSLEPPLMSHCFSCHSNGWLPLMMMDIASIKRDGNLFSTAEGIFNNLDLEMLSQCIELIEHKEKAEKLRAERDFVDDMLDQIRSTYEKFNEEEIGPFMGRIPRYALNRGITVESAKRWNLGYDDHPEHPRLVFPVRDRKSNLVGAIGRRIRESTLQKYYNYWNFPKSEFLYGQHLVTSDYVIVVEGPIDAVIVDSYDIPVVALMGSKMSDKQADLLAEYRKVLLAFDDDESGLRGKLDAIDRLNDRVILALLSISDGRDPANYTRDEMYALIEDVNLV